MRIQLHTVGTVYNTRKGCSHEPLSPPSGLAFRHRGSSSTSAQTVYMQDTPADTGVEPNPDTGPMWVSQDIWVRNSPDPAYQPYPFTRLTAVDISASPKSGLSRSIEEHAELRLRGGPQSQPRGFHRHGTPAGLLGKRVHGTVVALAVGGLSAVGTTDAAVWRGDHKATKERGDGQRSRADAYVNADSRNRDEPLIRVSHGGGLLAYPAGQFTINGYVQQHSLHISIPAVASGVRQSIRNSAAAVRPDRETALLGLDHESDDHPILHGQLLREHRRAFQPDERADAGAPSVTRSTSGPLPAESDSAVLARSPYCPYVNYSCVPPPTAPFMAALEDCSHNHSHGHIGGNSMC